MMFNLVICPKCGKKKITEVMVIGTPCSCGISLCSDDEENKKDIRKEQVTSANAFSRTFEEFEKHIKYEEERWNKENCFATFKRVEIPDDKLLELLNG
jgi:hypothetical protein